MRACFFLTLVLLTSSVAAEQGFGDLTARFQVTGEVRAPAKLNVNKDQAYCGKHVLVDETVVVGKDGGLANVVVYLVPERGQKVPENPELKRKLPAEVSLAMVNCRFNPHIAVVTTDQKLAITNSDPVGHNSKIDLFLASGDLIPTKGKRSQSFLRAERVPAQISCNIHPWMRGYLVVRDNPYTGVSDEDGNLKIEGVPAGEWAFTVWHETGYVKGHRDGEDLGWKRGKVTVKIEPGEETDLGTMEVPAASLWK